jgi:TatD DNase family protein
MGFCDTHIHLLDPAAKGMADVQVMAAAASGIDFFIQPGVRVTDWDAMLALTEHHQQVYAAPGIHPMGADQWDDKVAFRLKGLTRHPKVVAIGEIGLDAVVGPAQEVQEQTLRAQLKIALDAGLPVILHCRHKNGALLDILRELEIGQRVGGVWHGFSAGCSFARQVVALGFFLGIGPILLRNNVRKLAEVVAGLPAGTLVLETDYPDMAAEPADLLKIAAKVALLRNISLEETVQITTGNARRLFPKLQDNNR